MTESYNRIFFSDKLDRKYKSDLETLFFFNINQNKYLKKINDNVNNFGEISIKYDDKYLHLLFDQKNIYPALYVFDDESKDATLIGVIVYDYNLEEGCIIHLAVDALCASTGKLSNEMLSFRIIEKVRSILKSKGIKKFKLPYSNCYINTESKLTRIIE